MAHFIKAWRNQAAEANNIDLFFNRFVDNVIGRHHHTHINNIEIIALQNHANDVFANIVHIAFHCRH